MKTRTISSSRIAVPVRVVGMIGLLLCRQCGVPSAAQTASRVQSGKDTEVAATKINGMVHLMLGTVTLPRVCAALSAQTGLTIESAPYLRERRLIVHMDDLSARDALNALAELNDWTWTDKGEGHIVITRRTLLMPQEPGTIPRRMQMALPKDMRTFLSIKTPDANYRQYVPPFGGNYADGIMAQGVPLQTSQKASAHLLDALKPKIFDGKPLAYTAMTPLQQQDMVAWALFKAIANTNASLLHGDPLLFVTEPARADLKLNDNTLMVSITTGMSEDGFGAQMTPDK